MEKLFAEFSAANADAWKARLEKDLKGITFEQLSTIDRNGINIHPFYTKEDITATSEPVLTQAGWDICSEIKVKEAKTANREALSELNNGASGLCFIIEKDTDAAVLLNNIELPYIYSHFRIGNDALNFVLQLQQYFDSKNWKASEMNCFISFDIIHHYLKEGSWPSSKEKAQQDFLSYTETSGGFANIGIDATLFQNAGANTSYELACALAQVNEYLNILEENKKLQELKRLHITLATDTGFYEQIAKIRAFRTLLSLLLEQYNIQPDVHLHAETSNIYRSTFDSYSNLLRDTIAGMAAIIGGCNSLYIHPFDETLKEPNDFSKRMSRNQQLIFKEESYLDKVADAATGSYYIETLTDQIAAKAWELFKEIESNGGLIASFEKGFIGDIISQQAQELIQEYKDGKRVLIGVNKFPNPKDEPKPGASKKQAGNGLQPVLLSDVIIK